MSDKTVLITGSTDGIGQRCALELAKKGVTVLLHGRNPSRGNAVLDDIKNKSGHDAVDLFLADFGSLTEVRRLAAEVIARYPRLNVLVNNAGTYAQKRLLTVDGYETTFAVNHLAPFLLTNLLLDTLKKNAPSKIVVVSSVAHQNARVVFDNLQGEKHFDPYGAYSLSKLANLLFTYELAERLKGVPVTANALHPGVIETKLLRAGFASLQGASIEDGASRILHLIESPRVNGVSGKYFVNDAEKRSSPESRDANLQARIWSLSERMVGLAQNT